MTLLWLWCDSHLDTWLMTWVSTEDRSSGGRVELSLFLCWNFLLDGCGGDNIFAHMHLPWRTWFRQGAKASIARMGWLPMSSSRRSPPGLFRVRIFHLLFQRETFSMRSRVGVTLRDCCLQVLQPVFSSPQGWRWRTQAALQTRQGLPLYPPARWL